MSASPMARKRRACARAARVAGVVALAAAALLARDRLGARGAASPGSGEVGARGSPPASAGLASRVPTWEASDAFDADGAVVSSPTTNEAVERAGGAARVRARAASVSSSAFPPRGEARATERHELIRSRVVRLDEKSASARYGFRDDSLVAATFATAEVVDMLRNWVAHALFVARFPDVAIVALDEATLETCANANEELFVERPRGENTQNAPMTEMTCLDATRGFFQDADALSDVSSSKNGPLIGHRENKAVFNQIGIVKTRVLSALLRANVTTLMSDVDVVWLRDPRNYLKSGELRRAHVAASSDCVFGFEPNRPPTDTFGQKPSPNNAEFNTGVLLLRPTRETITFVERWTASQLTSLLTNHEMNDQSHFNLVVNGLISRRVEIRSGDVFAWDDEIDEALSATIVGSYDASYEASSSHHETSRDKNARGAVPESELFPEAHERGLRPRYYLAATDYPNGGEKNAFGAGSEKKKRTRVALLPTGLFSNGHTFFVSRLAEKSGVTPFAVHNTYQYSGTAGKIARFRENGLWAVDDASYYGVGEAPDAKATRKFLLLKYDVPRFLADPKRAAATPKGGTPHAHIELMTYQVNRVRDGLALAQVLNRTLVMPPLLSTCDRWFNLLPNCTQGDATFPMLAPVDHAFLVFALDAFEGGGKYVEHAFFANRARFVARSYGRETKKEAHDEDGDDEEDETETETETNAFGLGPVARLEFRAPSFAEDAFETEKAPFRVPEDFKSVPGYEPLDKATERAIQSVKRGSPRHFSVEFGSVAAEVVAALGGMNDARLLVAERLRPGAFGGFGSAEANAAFQTKITPLMHEWCCRKNGTVPHLPTPYGEEERYGEYERIR